MKKVIEQLKIAREAMLVARAETNRVARESCDSGIVIDVFQSDLKQADDLIGN
jgi:hypothetical protein